MTVREMMSKLQTMIDVDPSVADLEVDADGCDCIGDALDVRINGDRMLVARDLPQVKIVDPLSDIGFVLLRFLSDGRSVSAPEGVTQPDDVVELRTRGFVVYKFGQSSGRWIVISDRGREYLKHDV